MNLPTKQQTVSTTFLTELDVANRPVLFRLEILKQSRITWLKGGMAAGQSFPVVAFLQSLIPDLPIPDSMQGLTITRLQVETSPATQVYNFEAEIANVWSLDLGFDSKERVNINTLRLSTSQTELESRLTFVGEFTLFGGQFNITLDKRSSRGQSLTNEWTFKAGLATGQTIQLATLVNKAIGATLDSTFRLDTLTILVLGFQATQVKTSQSTQSSYSFGGAIEWVFTLAGTEVAVAAAVALEKKADGSTNGEIAGSLSTPLPSLEYLKLSVVYKFTSGAAPSRELLFKLQLSKLLIEASYNQGSGDSIITFRTSAVNGQALTFGELITFMVNLVDPGVDDFELDSPWDELNEKSLAGIEVKINLTQKSVVASYRPPTPLSLGFISITSIGLVYQSPNGKNRPRGVDLQIEGSFLGRTFGGDNALKWDAINQSPPEVPGQNSAVFELRYLGMGQRVSFAPEVVAELQNIRQVMAALQSSMQPLSGDQKNQNPLAVANGLQFNADSGWLIGADFTVIGTVSLTVIFNDPLIYGLRIALAGEKAKKFAGLEFEILYRRISDTIGVYHIELVLPDAMRQLEFGAVSVTLPVIVVDIYTNGDFKLDFGFPWKFNFARSFAVEAFPFTGAGGFYFNKLSAETATSVPIITNGVFNPVIEFGLGLKIGLGKTFNKGVLRAELSITVQGILEGIIAWFKPNDPSLPTDQYYRIQGGVAIVGRLWGLVDFSVIQVEVEVLVRVSVVFLIEAYEPIYLTLTAEVSVRASIKIAFIRIRFSFNLTLTQSFTLGSKKPTPWILSPDQSKRKAVGSTGTQAMMASAEAMPMASFNMADMAEPMPIDRDVPDPPVAIPMFMDSQPFNTVDVPAESVVDAEPSELPSWTDDAIAPVSISAFSTLAMEMAATPMAFMFEPTPLSWQPIQVVIPGVKSAEVSPIQLYFQLSVTYSNESVHGVALLFIENSIAPDSTNSQTYEKDAGDQNTPFDLLMQTLLVWAIHAYDLEAGQAVQATQVDVNSYGDVSLNDLETLYAMFVEHQDDDIAPFTIESLIAFLNQNFVFDITDRPSSNINAVSGTVFPMLPHLQMQPSDRALVRFSGDEFQLDEGDRQDFVAYFNQLKASHGSTVERPPGAASDASSAVHPQDSVATFIFEDYFGLLVRSVLESAIAYLTDVDRSTIPLTDLLSALNQNGQFNHIAGMASRFLLHGLRLPEWRDAVSDRNSPNRPTVPLYVGTGQQFPIPAKLPDEYTITLRPDLKATNPQINITLPDFVKSPGAPIPDTTELNYRLHPDLVKLVASLSKTAPQDLLLEPLTLTDLPFYTNELRRFSIHHSTDWTVPAATGYTILDLPDTLQDYLENKHQNSASPGVDLSLKRGTANASGEIHPDNIHPVSSYAWATRLKITVRRIPTTEGATPLDESGALSTGSLKTTYLLVGTDEEGKSLLEDLWVYLFQQQAASPAIAPQIYLLYPGSGEANGAAATGLTHQSLSHSTDILIVKTNLSTHTTTITGHDYWASLSEGMSFIKLLWESSTVNSGGYYLHYSPGGGLPNSTFADEQGASLTVLILLRSLPLDSPGGLAHHFQNCVVLPKTANSDTDRAETSLLFAEVADITQDPVKMLNIPAGHWGFKLSRMNDTTSSPDGIPILRNLYQMLGYRLTDTTAFRPSNEGLPLGPAESAPVPQKYTVQSNDTLQLVAERFALTTGEDEAVRSHRDKLLQIVANHEHTPDLLLTNQRIPLDNDATYTVKSGDSLSTIATVTGRTSEAIAKLAQGLPLTAGVVLQDTNDWLYERVFPIYRFAKTNSLSASLNALLPDPERNPYAGIAADAQITLELNWQDIYGNRFEETETPKTKSWNVHKIVHYFDPLLGINRWPSVTESYVFKPIESQPNEVELLIELILDQAPYVPVPDRAFAETQHKTSTARATYEQVYYQVHQPDVTFTVRPGFLLAADTNQAGERLPASHTLTFAETQPLIDFVESVYLYLRTVEQLASLSHSVAAGDSLKVICDAYYHVAEKAQATYQDTTQAEGQSLEFIEDRLYHAALKNLAATNADTVNFFIPGTLLTIHLTHRITATETLATIVDGLFNPRGLSSDAIAQKRATKLAFIAWSNADVSGILKPGIAIALEGWYYPDISSHTRDILKPGIAIALEGRPPYTTIAGDSFASIVRAMNASATNQTAPAKTILDVVNVLSTRPDSLESNASLRVELEYVTKEGDSLRSIEQILHDKLNVMQEAITVSLIDIAVQNRTVLLNPHMQPPTDLSTSSAVIIPDRVVIPAGLPTVMTIAAATSLQGITQQLLDDHRNRGASGTFSAADVAIANQNVIGLIQPGISISLTYTIPTNLSTHTTPIDLPPVTLTTRPNETFYTLAITFTEAIEREARNQQVQVNPRITAATIANAIADRFDVLVAGQSLIIPPVAIVRTDDAAEPSGGLAIRFRKVADDGTLLYPKDEMIFPVVVQIDMSRDPALVDVAAQAEVPEVQQVTAYLSPQTAPLTAKTTATESIASLQPFATHFRNAFTTEIHGEQSCLHLAIGNEEPHKHSQRFGDSSDTQITQPLWAVHLGKTGIEYNINESLPFFFTPVPLSNTLLGGTVELNTYQPGEGLVESTVPTRFDSIDVNELAHDFLVAVEAILDPSIVVPALTLNQENQDVVNNIESILTCKEKLADAIHNQVTHVLVQTTEDDISDRRNAAADLLRKQLLINLVEAYDIETIVQYKVDVSHSQSNWNHTTAPRLVGQPVVWSPPPTPSTDAKLAPSEAPDFVLSSAKIPLNPGDSHLTFFFNTRTPERFSDITLPLIFRVNEVEHDITDVDVDHDGIDDYQASSWLSFVLPIDEMNGGSWSDPTENPNYIGDVSIPIPLRMHPMPPSLVLHRAEADPDSKQKLQDIRQWQYTYVYEHLEIAQDTIETSLHVNTAAITDESVLTEGVTASSTIAPLFSALVNFAHVYPTLTEDLNLLQEPNVQDQAEKIGKAIAALSTLIEQVTDTWFDWSQNISLAGEPLEIADFEIQEDSTNDGGNVREVILLRNTNAYSLPMLEIPKYQLEGSTTTDPSSSKVTLRYIPKSSEDAEKEPIYGESSIPDRILRIPDLDIVQHQHAWAAIWLTRNKYLLPDSEHLTNPLFVFQTPEIRFANQVTPLLVNSRRWNIEELGVLNEPVPRSLTDHLQTLLATVLPREATKPFDIRIACRYAFALAVSGDDTPDLLSTLPVLLSSRFPITKTSSEQSNEPTNSGATNETHLVVEQTNQLRANLESEILRWFTLNAPSATAACFIFSIHFFTHPSDTELSDTLNVPLLKVEYLELPIRAIADINAYSRACRY